MAARFKRAMIAKLLRAVARTRSLARDALISMIPAVCRPGNYTPRARGFRPRDATSARARDSRSRARRRMNRSTRDPAARGAFLKRRVRDDKSNAIERPNASRRVAPIDPIPRVEVVDISMLA